MNNTTSFEKLIDILDQEKIDSIIEKYNGDKYIKTFFTKEHLKLFMFSEIRELDSLRDMASALKYDENLQNIIPLVSYAAISRNDSERNPQIFVEIFELVIKKMLLLNGRRILIETTDVGTIKILDSSTVTMSMKLFPWAEYKSGVAGVKFHTLFNLTHSCPEKIKLTNAEVHDVNILDEMISEPGITYLYDRAYVDYKKADIQTLNGIYFVSRLKSNAIINVETELELPIGSEIKEDKIVTLGNKNNKMTTKVRIVLVEDVRSKEKFYIVTNRFDLTADEISKLYRMRWAIELFFKFIKGHMVIKHFYGNSFNAVKTQLFIAMITYCLLMIIKIENKFNCSLLELLRAVKNSPWGKFDKLIKLFSYKVKSFKNKKERFNFKKEYELILAELEIKDEYVNISSG